MKSTAVVAHIIPTEERFEVIALSRLIESGHNPRKHVDEVKLDELAASIRAKGIVEPLVVRSISTGDFEIVCGARRFRAARKAGLQAAPCMVRPYTDVQMLEVMAIENGQRADVHPLDEAEGYQQLLKAEPGYTVEVIAAKVGKDASTIHKRLKLLRLEPVVQDAYLSGAIELGHAERISRLKPEQQAAALEACHEQLMYEDEDEPGQPARRLVSIGNFEQWVKYHVRLPLDAQAAATEPFPELRQALVESAVKGAPKLLEIVDAYYVAEKGPGAPLTQDAWKAVTGKPCEFAQRACIVLGRGKGRVLTVCTAVDDCKTHWQTTSRRTTTPATKRSKREIAAAKKAADEDRQRRADAARWRQVLDQAVTQVKKKSIKPGPAVLAVLRLAHWSAKSWSDVVAEVVENDLFIQSAADFKKAVKLLKPFGVNLAALDKALIAKEKAAETPAQKPSKKAKAAA